MKTFLKIVVTLLFLAAAAYGVLRLIDRVYQGVGKKKYVESFCNVNPEE